MNLRHTLIAAIVLAFGFLLVTDVSAQDDRDRKNRGGNRGDSTIDSRDTTKRDKRPKKDDHVDRGAAHMAGFYLRNDSCRRVLMSQLSSEDAEQLAALVAAHTRIANEIMDLRTQLREARAAGDTALFRRLSLELREAFHQQGRAYNALNELLRNNARLALTVMKECGKRPGRPEHDGKKRGNTDKQPEFGAMIVPNPVTAETAASTVVVLKLSAEAKVSIVLSDAAGVVIKTFDGTYAAGATKIPLDLSGLAPGPYHVRVQVGEKIQTLKVLIR